MTEVYVLDYGAGNVRSVVNALQKSGCIVKYITRKEDFDLARKLVFPGVGAFGSCVEKLTAAGFWEPLQHYLKHSGKMFFGICLGMQTLFESSEESMGVAGLGIIPGQVTRFNFDSWKPNVSAQGSSSSSSSLGQTIPSIPHMGWNQLTLWQTSTVLPNTPSSPPVNAEQDPSWRITSDRYYFVHSYVALPSEANLPWVLTTTDHGNVRFISAIHRGNIIATQFHPEKSGELGLALLKRFIDADCLGEGSPLRNKEIPLRIESTSVLLQTQLAKRIIACLDVRSNDAGDIVVTKGDQYDVREKDVTPATEGEGGGGSRKVRNLGKPVALAERYYLDGADEITFLNIISFRNSPMKDMPMLDVLRRTSEGVFVPLTIGGGIRDVVDPDGTTHSALQVATEYFRSGADKVSIGSDAVEIVLEYLARKKVKTGQSSIEEISRVYGKQAVVISVDPKRVYVRAPSDVPQHHTIATKVPGPQGEQYCWYQCTVRGGRETRDLGVYEFVQGCEDLGAGEILLNCIDKDGTNSGYDLELVAMVKSVVRIPVIASSGAGCEAHFRQVLLRTDADAALAAGIFHRNEVPLPKVKQYLTAPKQGDPEFIPIR